MPCNRDMLWSLEEPLGVTKDGFKGVFRVSLQMYSIQHR
jgi:hypothetical protein